MIIYPLDSTENHPIDCVLSMQLQVLDNESKVDPSAPATSVREDDYVLVLDRGVKSKFLKVKAVSAMKLWKAKGSNDTVKRKSNARYISHDLL